MKTTQTFIEALTSIKLWVSMILIASTAAIPALSQNLKSVALESRPGQTISVILSFDGPVELTAAGVSFTLQTLNEESQSRWTRSFNLNRLKPTGENKSEWEVSGEVPAYAASGVYRLISAWTNVAELSKSYDWPIPGHAEINLTITNDKKDPLRPLTDIRLVAGK